MAVHSRFLVCHLSSYATVSVPVGWQFVVRKCTFFSSCHAHAVTEFHCTTSDSPRLSLCPLALKGSLSCSSAWLQWPKYYPLTGPSRACMMKKNYQNKDEDCHLLSPWTVPWQPSLQAHVLVLDLASPCKLETGTQNGWPNPHGSKLYFHAWRVSKACIV